jgi:hypothetical protein
MMEQLIMIAKKEMTLKLSTNANSAMETYSSLLPFGFGSGLVAF